VIFSDSTGTVSGTVSAWNNVGLVRSRNIFVPELEHTIHSTESWGMWGVVRREC